MDGKAVAVLGGAAQRVDVGDVEFRIDALAEQVYRQCHDVDVAGAFAVSEQAPLYSVGPGEHAELGGGDRATAVVVRVQRQHHAVAVAHGAQEPLDGVG